MSLKRKASFSSETCPGRRFDLQTMDDIPHYMNSRTRKRFRDNRPDEQIVFANTLRLLYQAQKGPIVSTSPPNESPASDLPPEEPEALDPRQQTLLKFFQPAPALEPHIRADNRTYNLSKCIKPDAQPAQPLGVGFESDQNTAASGSSTPLSTSSTGMNVNMDIDSNMEDTSSKNRWTGGIGWM